MNRLRINTRVALRTGVFGSILWLATANVHAQPGRFAPPLKSPEISSERQVTFRIRAANADQVRLTGGDMPEIGRGQDMPLITEAMERPRDASAMAQGPQGSSAEPPMVVDVTPTVHEETPKDVSKDGKAEEATAVDGKAEDGLTPKDSEEAEQKPAPKVYTPSRPPDDPGRSPTAWSAPAPRTASCGSYRS